ncbi:MAG: electron transfer flavoprotein subunit alpha/FixB family protein [Nannocystaceae bacterium]|nr:electron transfer flavoprotein subunit alpha/FixB family protein [bacterium]
MSKVLVVVETDGNAIKSASLPGITAGAQLAQQGGGELHLLVVGAGVGDAANAIGQAGYGAAGVHVADHADLAPFTTEAWTDVVVGAAKALGATALGGTATSTLRDVIPRAAALLDAPLASEVTAVTGSNAFRREMSAGRAVADFTASGSVVCFTARASDFEPATPADAAPVAAVDAGTPNKRGAEVVSIEKTQSARPALTEANVVVAGGRGMGSGENFKPLEELTDLLGGALGASRAATDAGMVPADLQVGQTGKVVAPNLYFAVAISGAIQHLAGMKGSKTIVAINKDPEAPIFQVADYGLVAKWEDTLPQLIEAVKAKKG